MHHARKPSRYIVSVFLLICVGLIGGYLASLLRWYEKHPQRAQHATRPQTQPLVTAQVPERVSTSRMQHHIKHLTRIGVRRAGTEQERRAFEYITVKLHSWGYTTHAKQVPLPNGRQSMNVFADLPGNATQAMLFGAHVDSKYPSPGANDNASGVAVVLEMAYVLRKTEMERPCIFAFFGAEERIDRNRDHHHYGSRAMAADSSFRRQLYSMTSLDMVGVGTVLHIDNQGWASDRWRDHVARTAKRTLISVRTGRSRPWSDHEAFEKHGIPVAYIHWERDPHYHKAMDRPEYIQSERLRRTAEIILQIIREPKTNAGR